MNNRSGFNRLDRKPSHRHALHKNMVTSLFRHERIKTTKAKAKEVRRTAEKMVTRAKVDSVHNRRIIAKDIKDKEILTKLFTDISPRFQDRQGGYTRIIKLGFRRNDAAEMVLLELVEKKEEKKKKRKAPKAEKTEKKEPEEVKETAKSDEKVEEEEEEKEKEPAE
jgi:large subunit ribosomal protein L17